MSCVQYNISMNHYEIEYLILPNGKAPIIEWLNSLDSITRKRINLRILRIEDGNLGDYKKLSEDISELRFAFGKGYRIYYTENNNKIILFVDLDSQDNCFYFKALQYGKLGGKNEKNNSFRVV